MLTTLLTIWLLHVAALLSPGANVLLVSQLAASDRGKSALFAALGVTLGALLWATFAVLGVHAVFGAFPGLRLALQVLGGAYLLYVATRLWRSTGPELGKPAPAISGSTAFRLDFLTNITNTKSALFFGSVFAASFPAEPGAALQISAVAIRRQRAVLAHAAGLPVLTAARASRLCAITQHRQPRGLCVARRTGSGAAGVHLPRGPVIRASSHDPRTDKDARQRAVRPDRSGSGRGP